MTHWVAPCMAPAPMMHGFTKSAHPPACMPRNMPCRKPPPTRASACFFLLLLKHTTHSSSFFSYQRSLTPVTPFTNFIHSFQMKYSTLISMASAMAGLVSANSCTDANGYYYCDETSKFIYKNVGFSGSYSNVVSMNEDNTAVSYATSSFSGPLAPFDEELSVHVRGPINLQEFAVYYPASGASNKKRDTDAEEECSTTQLLHHKHVKRATKVVTQTMYVNQNGEAITQTVAINPTSAASVQ
ncbi:hypothetical protein OXX79_012143, partial [Metschnikowia pulcherrima]